MATSGAPDAAGPAVAARPLSAELEALRQRVAGGPLQLREVLGALQGRAYELLMVVLVLPFAVPVSVPGMSTPFGIVIAIVAAQLAASRLPWLPRRLLDARIPAGFLAKVLAAAQRVVLLLEKLIRPRFAAATQSRMLVGLHLMGIVLAALLVALPLPIPFTNMIPAWAILLIAMGLMERDGLFIAAGHLTLAASLVYFFLLGESIRQSLHWALAWLHR
jgi:hypothetical protein